MNKLKITFILFAIIIIPFLIFTGCTNSENNDMQGNEQQDNNDRLVEVNALEEGFKIYYPKEKDLQLSKNDGQIKITHAVPYEHLDPCNFKGDENQMLNEITDFDITIELIEKSLVETVKEREGEFIASEYLLDNKLKLSPGFIDEVRIGTLEGYKITLGVEGCGRYQYYIPVDKNKTLVVHRAFITELTPHVLNYEEYRSVQGIILPQAEELLFNEIISSIELLK